MKALKILTTLAILLISFVPFSKLNFEKKAPKLTLNEINIDEIISNQQFECRPSSKIMFYVETSLVKKSRGSSTINANIFILDRVSGKSRLLANENILVPFHKESVLKYDVISSNCDKIELTNGDKILGSDTFSPYCFNELIQNESIYNSYILATNKLLKINREL